MVTMKVLKELINIWFHSRINYYRKSCNCIEPDDERIRRPATWQSTMGESATDWVGRIPI
jgi:hypothetical protein